MTIPVSLDRNPKRIQRKRTKGWKTPFGSVYVGRPSRWGNPWRIGGSFHEATLGGDPWKFTEVRDAQHAVELYRAALKMPDRSEFVADIKAHLRGKDLACWCPLTSACHADVLLEIANEPGVSLDRNRVRGE